MDSCFISEAPTLDDTVDGAVDHKGDPAKRSFSGAWKSAYFIIGMAVVDRFAFKGIETNLINYLTGWLGESTAAAAANVNTWSGTATLLPLLGAAIADSYLGQYRTIVIASLTYILGLGLLTVSAVFTSGSSSNCKNSNKTTSCSPSQLQVVFFFFSLYVVAIGQGGLKPCLQAFGAEQFDQRDQEECKAKSSFFNWWFFGLAGGVSVSYLIMSYIEDNVSWILGFGIPCLFMVLGLLLFLIGTRTYRYSIKKNERSPFVRIGRVFVAAAKNWKTTPPVEATENLPPYQGSNQFKFLNKALLLPGGSGEKGKACSLSDVEEAKAVLRLFPIWATCLAYGIVLAQPPTLFTKQGTTLDRSIGSGFHIPAASLQFFRALTVLIFIPIYDRIFVPIARSLTRKPSGITMLQRIGTGIFLIAITMVIAALVELKRLKTAEEYELVDMPKTTLPMKVWWLIPQFIFLGISDSFTSVGIQEFFCDQMPNELRSVGVSLQLSIVGLGSLLSTSLISVIGKITSGDGRDSWFSDNLNRAHLDYFYWLLAGLTAIGLAVYLFFAKSYIYNRSTT
ncbi:protein NRT1/ PTR FAMILY 5.10-like isoform X2 [Vitis riparia]|uniref:protein NRT1/ PTR FAMILY 5.10-like isoform X2 n=1 Tax=Vitis riparia TaxID=96939 RepID=UPI00155B0F65|nr:protein NRT1/ PTR FAMILY 5.10-like isoform X2 [Vitis riparia]